jgi:C-terminal processing protease CtpA/Prc
MKIDIKKSTLLLVLAAVLFGCVSKQPKQYADYSSSSRFVVKNPDSVNVDNLVVLAKVWGFAKYHHPVFADSIHNIDYELFELLPKVAYTGKDECNDVLLDWVKGLGAFKTNEKKLRKEIDANGYTSPADWEWLADEELLGAELSGLLQDLRWAERVKPSRYAKYMNNTGQADFRVESGAGPMSQKDTGYNLLTLMRLWNMAEYYFPSVGITNKKWSEVLTEYMPKFLNTQAIEWTTAELITELSDTHSAMSRNPVYSSRRLPVELMFVEGKLVVTENRKYSAATQEPVFALGDEIISIEGHTPDYFIDRARHYIAASNENALLRDAARLAKTVSGNTVSVVVKRADKTLNLDIATISTKESYANSNEWLKGKPYYELMDDTSIGYMYAAKFKNGDSEDIMAKFKDTKAIIIDLRCYPGGFMPFELTAGYFIPDKFQFVEFTQPAHRIPGYYQKLGVEQEMRKYGIKLKANKDYYKGMVVVLVNEHTQSSAEYQTMAFQAAPNCVVVGSQTAGADGNVSSLPLPRNIMTWFSGLGVFYPDGTNTQRAGIRIDHYVEPTIEGIREGRDEVLEKALEIIEAATIVH